MFLVWTAVALGAGVGLMVPRRTRRFAWIPSAALGVFFGATIGAYVALPSTGLFLMVNTAGLALVAVASLVAGLPVVVAGLLLAPAAPKRRHVKAFDWSRSARS